MPFLAMSKLAVNNFTTELSALLVVPKVYLKEFTYTLEKMEQWGYIIEQSCFLLEKYDFFLNLNYFRDFYKKGHIIDPNTNEYSEKYELKFTKKYSTNFKKSNLNLLDFLILDRIRFFSYVGVTFSRRTEIANVIKTDWNNYSISEKTTIKEIEKNYEILTNSPSLQEDFLNYLRNNQSYGFFYLLYDLEKWVNYAQIIEKVSIGKNSNFTQFKQFYEKENILRKIEESEIFDGIDSNSKLFKSIFLSYINDRKYYEKEVNKFKFYYQFMKLCSILKVISLISVKRLVSNPNLLRNIVDIKKKKLRDISKREKIKYATSTSINLRINDLLDKKIIKPYLIDSIWNNSVASYFPQMILKNSSEVREKIEQIKYYFPKVYFYNAKDLFNHERYIFFQFFIPFLTNSEKVLFLSLLYHLFKKDLLSFKRYSWNGFLRTFSRKDFYDFQNKEFFYTRDLYDQYFLYVRRTLGEELKPIKDCLTTIPRIWSYTASMSTLAKKVRMRIKKDEISFDAIDLQNLINFNLNLVKILTGKQFFIHNRKEIFFKRYIRSIKVIPTLKKFGFGQFFLYVTPFNYDEIDLKLLLSNTFQSVKHLASIDSTDSLLIKYIFPFNEPNTSYLNWLAKSKRNVRDYCLFSIKSITQIFQLNTNLTSNGWNIDPNNLKTHIQNVLFNPHCTIQSSDVKRCNIGDLVVTDNFKPNSPQFKALTQVYNWKSINLKETLDSMNQSIFEEIRALIKEELVYPYISLKNLDFKEKIHIFLLNLEEDTLDTLKEVFQFFNFGYIYDIEGEYYIYGFKKEKKIKKGLIVKLYLPDCELSEILRTLEYIFQYLKVERYLILTDLVDGKHLLKSIYGGTEFLKDYNPLQNLIWLAENNKWKNHRLFTDDFQYVYPELIFKEK